MTVLIRGGTVINADSMQVYGELRVLTARPAAADLLAVPHRLYGTVPATEAYSVGRWLGDAAAAIEEALRAFCEANDWSPKELFMPVRIAVTGRTATPPLFETMEVLGKERCRRRLRQAIETLKTIKS